MSARRGRRTKKAASRPARRASGTKSARRTSPRKSAKRAAAPAKKRVTAAKKRASAKKRPTIAKKRTAPKKRTAAPARPTKKKSAAKKRAAASARLAKKKAAPKKRAAAPARLAKKKAAAPARVAKRKPAAKKRAASPPAPNRLPAPRTGKAGILMDLRDGRDAVFAACRELTRETWEVPIAPGKWTPRQIVAHLAYWDSWLISELPAAVLNARPGEITDEHGDALNAKAVAAMAHLDADTTLGEYLDGRAQLISSVDAISAEPASTWTQAHAVGWLTEGWALHDRHHARQLHLAATRRAFATQRAGANERELLLFELQRARVTLLAALKGLPAHAAEAPMAPGKWSVRELVLHCAVRDRVRLEEFDSALGGTPASWIGLEDARVDELNERHLAELRHLSWDEAVRLLNTTRESLVHRLLAVPAEPADVWRASHAFGRMLHGLPPHDRKHAEQIKHARIEG